MTVDTQPRRTRHLRHPRARFVLAVLNRYVDVPALGPVPRMYEPVWFAEKTRSAFADGAAALL